LLVLNFGSLATGSTAVSLFLAFLQSTFFPSIMCSYVDTKLAVGASLYVTKANPLPLSKNIKKDLIYILLVFLSNMIEQSISSPN